MHNSVFEKNTNIGAYEKQKTESTCKIRIRSDIFNKNWIKKSHKQLESSPRNLLCLWTTCHCV